MADKEELKEKRTEEGLAVQDMIKMKGWKIYEARVKRELQDEYDLIRTFPIEKRSLQEIAAEYLEHRANLNAYERALGFIQEFLKAIK
jgi:hypothetical protein